MKLFGKGGKLNIIDIILIVAVLAAIVFVFIAPLFSSDDSNNAGANSAATTVITDTSEEEISEPEEAPSEPNLVFTVVCKEVDEMLANGIMESLDSDDIMLEDEEAEDEQDSMKQVSMKQVYNNYELIDAYVTEWEYVGTDLILTLEAVATSDRGTLMVGTQGVRVGRTYVVKTLGMEIEGVIYTMENTDE